MKMDRIGYVIGYLVCAALLAHCGREDAPSITDETIQTIIDVVESPSPEDTEESPVPEVSPSPIGTPEPGVTPSPSPSPKHSKKPKKSHK